VDGLFFQVQLFKFQFALVYILLPVVTAENRQSFHEFHVAIVFFNLLVFN